MRAASRYTVFVGLVAVAAFALRLWSAGRWTWYADDWIYLHDASTESFLSYVAQVYQGHLMPGQFAVVWVLGAVAPLNHGLVVLVTATWAAALVSLWGLALRELWGTGPVTWAVLLLVTLSPILVLPTTWWASTLQTLALQTCLAACLYYAGRLIRSDGAIGTVGLVVSFAVGLLMWEKVVLLALPVVVILLHATPGPLRESLRRYRRAVAWLAGLSAGYVLVFLAASRTVEPDAQGAVHIELGRSPGEIGGFFYDLWAHLLAPGVLGGPWDTLPTAEEFDSRPPVVVSVSALVALVALVAWLLRRDRRAGVPLAAAALYAAAAWGSILFTSRFDATSWYRFTYERYAVDAFVVLAVLLGAAAARPVEREEREERTGVPGWLAPTAVGLLAVSLCVGSVAAVLRLGESSGGDWMANVERGIDEDGSVTLVDRYAPDSVMEAAFWAEKAKLSYLLAPWADRVSFQGPAEELSVVADDGRVSAGSFGPASSAPVGPVADCGYAVEPGAPQTVRLEQELFAFDWVLKVDAFSGSAGTLVVRGDEEHEVPIPEGISSHLLVFSGTPDSFELEMAEGSATTCVTGLSVGTVTAAED